MQFSAVLPILIEQSRVQLAPTKTLKDLDYLKTALDISERSMYDKGIFN